MPCTHRPMRLGSLHRPRFRVTLHFSVHADPAMFDETDTVLRNHLYLDTIFGTLGSVVSVHKMAGCHEFRSGFRKHLV